MNQDVFASIEEIMRENGLKIPPGRGKEKLAAIKRLVESEPMREDDRERLRNLLKL